MTNYTINIIPVNWHGVPMFDCSGEIPNCIQIKVNKVSGEEVDKSIIMCEAKLVIEGLPITDKRVANDSIRILAAKVTKRDSEESFVEVYVAFEFGKNSLVNYNKCMLRSHDILNRGTETVRIADNLVRTVYNSDELTICEKPYKVLSIVVDANGTSKLRNVGGQPFLFTSRVANSTNVNAEDVYKLAEESISECLINPSHLGERLKLIGNSRHYNDSVQTFYACYYMTEQDCLSLKTVNYVDIDYDHEDYDICLAFMFKRLLNEREFESRRQI